MEVPRREGEEVDPDLLHVYAIIKFIFRYDIMPVLFLRIVQIIDPITCLKEKIFLLSSMYFQTYLCIAIENHFDGEGRKLQVHNFFCITVYTVSRPSLLKSLLTLCTSHYDVHYYSNYHNSMPQM